MFGPGVSLPAYLHRAVTRKWFRDGRKGDSAEGAGIWQGARAR